MVRLKIAETAKEQDFTIAKLARRADTAYATVYKAWHNQHTGKGIGILTLAKIAKALGVKVVDLIEETEE